MENNRHKKKVSSHPFCWLTVCVYVFQTQKRKEYTKRLNRIEQGETLKTRNAKKKIVNMKLTIIWNRHAAIVNLQTVNTSPWFVCRMLSWKDCSHRFFFSRLFVSFRQHPWWQSRNSRSTTHTNARKKFTKTRGDLHFYATESIENGLD